MEKIEHSSVKTNGIKMHIASIGSGPVVLFLHGFPDLWYSWRHQLLALASLGYRAIAPDLRGYGDTDAPPSPSSYTAFHIVGDLVGLLDSLRLHQVFLVGHDFGAVMAWYFCLFNPERVKALVNLSVAFIPRNPQRKPLESMRLLMGDNYYICRFQKPGEVEEEFARAGTARIIKKFLTSRNPRPPCVPKEIGFGGSPDTPITLPSWLSEEDVNYYATKFDQKGFTGGLNYYRALDLTWELTAPWTGLQIKVPVKFIIGDLDITYNTPGAKEYIHNGGFKRDVPFLQEVVVMEGVAHFLNQERPEEISAHIYEFINKFSSELPLASL
ncbi:bifunctional epoxide hydrolase 2 [Senna tora]|uniref:soluble epoxide hydrolase n=1 Tax=Senna tora TaxID=362788 RepID=A0A834SM34_9FABA|nr:bifunctional epoxide hydrolase 2 [Senna tora]